MDASEYNRGRAFGYDEGESRLKKCIRIMRGIQPGLMLDIGCSSGEWLAYWIRRGWKGKGVDINPAMVRAARSQGLDVQVCDVAKSLLPYQSGTFDLVFAGEIIEHLVDTDSFLGEVSRCLKTEGFLVITTPNLASLENRIKLCLGRYPRWMNYRLDGVGHVRAYTPAALKRQLHEHGLSLCKHTGNWVPILPQSLMDDVKYPWLALSGDWLPNLAMDIIVLAQKTNTRK